MSYRHPGVPRRFWLVTDASSTIVAEGTQSSQGRVVVFPADAPPTIWPGLDALLTSKPGTVVHWLDTDRIEQRCIL